MAMALCAAGLLMSAMHDTGAYIMGFALCSSVQGRVLPHYTISTARNQSGSQNCFSLIHNL